MRCRWMKFSWVVDTYFGDSDIAKLLQLGDSNPTRWAEDAIDAKAESNKKRWAISHCSLPDFEVLHLERLKRYVQSLDASNHKKFEQYYSEFSLSSRGVLPIWSSLLLVRKWQMKI